MLNNRAFEAVPLAPAYRSKIGKVTFQVSSFWNPQANHSAQKLIISMLEKKAMEKQPETPDKITQAS